jgi:hypothetical protein
MISFSEFSLPELSEAFATEIQAPFDLTTLLAKLSGPPCSLSSHITDASPAVYLEAIVFLIRHRLVRHLHTYVYLPIPLPIAKGQQSLSNTLLFSGTGKCILGIKCGYLCFLVGSLRRGTDSSIDLYALNRSVADDRSETGDTLADESHLRSDMALCCTIPSTDDAEVEREWISRMMIGQPRDAIDTFL